MPSINELAASVREAAQEACEREYERGHHNGHDEGVCAALNHAIRIAEKAEESGKSTTAALRNTLAFYQKARS